MKIQLFKERNSLNFQTLQILTLPTVIFEKIFTYFGSARLRYRGNLAAPCRRGEGEGEVNSRSWYLDSAYVKNFYKSKLGNRDFLNYCKFIYYPLQIFHFSIAYISVTEHPGPLKLWRVWTVIFVLESKSGVRISKFALIKKVQKFFKFF